MCTTMCPQTTVSSYYYVCPHTAMCPHTTMCPHNTVCVSANYYTCVLILLLHMCPHTFFACQFSPGAPYGQKTRDFLAFGVQSADPPIMAPSEPAAISANVSWQLGSIAIATCQSLGCPEPTTPSFPAESAAVCDGNGPSNVSVNTG